MIKSLFLAAVLAVSAMGATITVDQSTSYQTITGWENGAIVRGMAGSLDADTTLPYIRDDLVDILVDSIGLTRMRVEVRCGAENPVDNYAVWKADTSDSAYQIWRTKRYEAINDNDDPLDLDMNGFHFSEYDYHMNRIVVPIKQKLQSNGEDLYLNLCFVAFGGAVNPHLQRDPDEYAEFMLAAFIHTENTYGFVPDAVEVILEPDVASFGDGTLVGQCIVAAGDLLKANGYTPDFIGPSNTNLDNAIEDFDLMIQVPGVTNYLTEFSYHAYAGRNDANLQAIAGRSQTYGIGCAMLEWWSYSNANYERLHRDLAMGMNTAWQMKQSLATEKGYTGNGEGLVEVDFTDGSDYSLRLAPDVKYIRNYWKFIRPGSVRKAAATGDSTFEPLAFINPDGNAVMVVKANGGGSFTVAGMPAGTYGLTYTTGNWSHLEPTAYDVRHADQTIAAGEDISTSIPGTGVITIFQKSGGIPVASPGELEFDVSAYAVAETSGSVTVTVNRVNGSDSAVTVGYTAYGGSATDGADYDSVTGTLNWNDGDATAKSFTVTILDDTTAESDETITVTLSNATGGASLGSPATAFITITDDDSVAAPDTADTTVTPPDTSGAGVLMGYWGFENNADDGSGNGYHGTWAGSAAYDTGSAGQGMSSAGGDYVTVNHADGLDGLTALTWSLWLKRNPGAATNDVIYKHQAYRLRIMSDRFTGTLYNTAGASKDFSVFTSAFTDTQWHHVAFTWDGTTVLAYLDGVHKASVAFTGALAVQPSRDLYFGKYPWGNAFNGMLDEIRLYDGVLDSAAVAALANPVQTPLPVELASFTAVDDTGAVLLEWSTASELRNLGFNLQRSSTAGGSYADVNQTLIPGAGTVSQPQTYAFVDSTAPAGTWYYRLEQVDSSGGTTLFGPVAVTVAPQTSPVYVSGMLPALSGPVRGDLLTLDGIHMLSIGGSGTGKIRTLVRNAVPARGIYLLRITGDGATRIEKMCVLH